MKAGDVGIYYSDIKMISSMGYKICQIVIYAWKLILYDVVTFRNIDMPVIAADISRRISSSGGNLLAEVSSRGKEQKLATI